VASGRGELLTPADFRIAIRYLDISVANVRYWHFPDQLA
jgi:hypothetical protein